MNKRPLPPQSIVATATREDPFAFLAVRYDRESDSWVCHIHGDGIQEENHREYYLDDAQCHFNRILQREGLVTRTLTLFYPDESGHVRGGE